MLNCYFGGTLTQHLPDHPESSTRGRAGHRVLKVLGIEEGEFVLDSKKGKEGREIGGFEVNSHHHQGVMLENLSPEFIPMYASLDDVVEIMQHKTRPIFAIQSHPEEFYTLVADLAFRALLDFKEEVPVEKASIKI